MDNVIWAVSEGDYSDYRVLGVFTSKEKAEEYAKTDIYSRVENFPIDPVPDEKILDIVKSGDKIFMIHMQFNGDAGGHQINYTAEYGYDSVFNPSWDPDRLSGAIRARDLESAIKIMNEYRIRYIAEKDWGLK